MQNSLHASALVLLLAYAGALPAFAADNDAAADGSPSFGAQLTNVTQWHGRFRSPYSGPNSLQASEAAKETTDVTVFAGWRIGAATELWINPEFDQGFGLSDTLGLAGFSSGEAYKVGATQPYPRLQRAIVRHTVSLGGDDDKIESGANQFAIASTADRLVLTAGKFSVVDIFDANSYAHDPRGDFFNWSVIDAGAFDYAADSWGYTFGAAAEWTHGAWTLRAGAFQMSAVPNAAVTGLHPREHMWVAEAEHRHEWSGHPGKVKLLAFSNHANMASYADAVALAAAGGSTPDVSLVRRMQTRNGIALNAEQEVAKDLGVFARASANDGRKEAYEFTEINRSFSAGLALKGTRWGRGDDTFGLALASNRLSSQARAYFAAGGMGILIGDGALNYGAERIAEAFYSARLNAHVTLSFDVQRIVHPAYNVDRGPVTIYGTRLHAEL